jgi:hypothetical protein
MVNTEQDLTAVSRPMGGDKRASSADQQNHSEHQRAKDLQGMVGGDPVGELSARRSGSPRGGPVPHGWRRVGNR